MNEIIFDNIGLDMDGVLVDLEQYQLEKGIAYFCKKFNKKPEEVIKNINAYDIEDIFGCTKNERMEFWIRYIWEYCLLFPAKEGSSEITQKWHQEGRNIDIITSRVYVMQDDILGALFRKMVKIWLHSQKIHYDNIVFCSEKESAIDKSKACLDCQTKIMGEDKLDNIEAIRKNSMVACFDAKWNHGYQADNVYRVKNIYDMDKLIDYYEKGNKILPKTLTLR